MPVKQPFLNLSTSDLIERQTNLQAQAQDVIQTLDLLNLLQTVGQPQIVGSLSLKLMVWPDIDIEVLTTGSPDIDGIFTCAKHLLAQPGISRLTIADERQTANSNIPSGVYLGPDYYHQTTKWQIDIWFIDQTIASKHRDLIASLKAKLTPDNRLIILQLKQILAANPQYHKTISSLDIYQAVLNHGAATIDQFQTYLQRTGRNL